MSGEFAFDETYGRLLKFLQKYYFKVRDRTDTDDDVRELDKILSQCEWIQRVKELEEELNEIMVRKDEIETYWRTAQAIAQAHIDTEIELTKEVMALKEQNKELMRDNAQLREPREELIERHMCEIAAMRHVNEKLQRDYDLLCDKEPHQWYDAEKCLPRLNAWVEIEYENVDYDIEIRAKVQLRMNGDNYSWYELYTDDELYPAEIKAIKWRYADENN